MANELDKLSSEDIKALSQAINEAKAILVQQQEMIEKVLEGEAEIHRTRTAFLKEYTDLYSKSFNAVLDGQNKQLKKMLSDAQAEVVRSYTAATSEGSTGEKNQETAKKSKRFTKKNTQTSKDADEDNVNVSRSTAKRSKEGLQPEAVDVSKYTNEYLQGISQQLLAAASKSSGDLKDTIDRVAQEDLAFSERVEAIKEARETEWKQQQAAWQTECTKAVYESVELQKTDVDIQKRMEALQQESLISALQASNAAAAAQNSLDARLAYLSQGMDPNKADEADAAAKNEARALTAKEDEAALKTLMERMEKERQAKIERETAKAEAKGEVVDEDKLAEIIKQANLDIAEKYSNNQDARLKEIKDENKQKEKDEKKKERLDAGEKALNQLTGKGVDIKDRMAAWKKLTTDEETGKTSLKNSLIVMGKMLSNFAKDLEKTVDDIGSYKGAIDTRLQGSKHDTSFFGSYWDNIFDTMTSLGAVNPFFKQQDFANNIKSLVESGIAFDLEERAFLMTIKDKIAGTFDVNNGVLLRLVRIQQEDSTAGRLGMESALNAFLNEMYETSEYLQSVASSVRTSLEEMESLMSGAEAAEVEFEVQKWLGSLYSVGMSDTAVQSISNALGQIAAGQIEGLTGNGAGNLLIMAANEARVPISDILTNGITAEETNRLLASAVSYLAELAESSKDNKVVQQQLANVFGVKASDLKAATNLISSSTDVFNESMTYENMLNRLFTMAGSMGARTSMAEVMTNIWENGKYTLAGSMATNPVAYLTYKLASLLDDTTGGIPIPDISIIGNAVALNTTVADLMRVGALSVGVLGSLGPILSGLGNSFSGQKMLQQLGIEPESGLKVVERGGLNVSTSAGLDALIAGTSGGAGASERGTSESGGVFAGNASGSDIKNATIQGAEDDKKKLMVEAKEEAEANQVDVLNTTVIKIYELLENVASGKSSFRVKVDSYGLTGVHSASSSGAGLAALSSGGNSTLTSRGNYSNSDSVGSIGTSGSTGDSSGFGGAINLGGWTTSM